MGISKFPIVLSVESKRDLDAIFDYTEEKYDLDQAISYLNGFHEIFKRLGNNPDLGRNRNEIREGLRSITKDRHLVFYRVLKDRVRVVRILHGNRDLPNFWP